MQAELEEFIDRKVALGDFRSREELVEAAVAIYRDLEELDELRIEVGRRIEEARQGRVAPLDIADLKSRLLNRWKAQST